MTFGPFKYVEWGYINGFRSAGMEVAIWDGSDADELKTILADFKPDLFVGYLRRGQDRANSEWMSAPHIEHLLRYRKEHGLWVAMHANPDVRVLMQHLELSFIDGDVSLAGDFYTQKPPPTPVEAELVGKGFIDIILHNFSQMVSSTCFEYWRTNGIHVLEEPLAADTQIYRPAPFPKKKRYDISFVGGWWPFKGQQLDLYVEPLYQNYGNRLHIFGRGWTRYSKGHISDEDYMRTVWESKINLIFHEPSQVQGVPIHVNERIFKLGAMGAFAICDNNPSVYEYFDKDEITVARTPEEMVDLCRYYLRRPLARWKKARKLRRAILDRHTYHHRAKKLLDTCAGLK